MEKMAYRIRTRRNELGLKQADLAAICGVSPTGVAKWERGATHNLKGEHLFILADALNVNARWLAIGDGPKIANSDREAYYFAIEKSRKAIDREQTAWHRIAAAFSRAALLAMVLIVPPQQDGAATSHNLDSDAVVSSKLLSLYTFWAYLMSKLFQTVQRFVLVQTGRGLRKIAARWSGYIGACRVYP